MNFKILHNNTNGSAIHKTLEHCPFFATELIKAIISSNQMDNMAGPDSFLLDEETRLKIENKKISYFGPNTPFDISENSQPNTKVVISNSRFNVQFDESLLNRIFEKADADIICIEIDHHLCGYREKATFDSNNNLAGLRRIYSDLIIPTSLSDNWPEFVIISSKAISRERGIKKIPSDFDSFICKCNRKSLTVRTFRVAGISHDLYDPSELLSFLEDNNALNCNKINAKTAPSAKLIGPVAIGPNTTIDDGSIIIGPCIIGANCTINKNTVVRNAIIADNFISEPDSLIEKCFISSDVRIDSKIDFEPKLIVNQNLYKKWHLLSYAKLWKRIIDITFSSFILLMSLPVFLIVTILIKIYSPGPIFFKHKRQGLHGKEFGCIKFRTMIHGADDIQDQLRKINEVDGPQFKMEDDPRVSPIGRFLRDTCIDEIPQFINVLLGEMSVIGPRPSPEKENSFCAYWRDARLSVRPGITGLWQVMRTRKEGQDFQEWVIHDTNYVKRLTIWEDIKICLLTVKYIVKSFIEQF